MPDRVSPGRTVTVRPPLPAEETPPLWQTVSPGNTSDGLPLGTVTFHQSGQNIETYWPDWTTRQSGPQDPVDGCGAGSGAGSGAGVGLTVPSGRLPAYAYQVSRSPYTTLRSRLPDQPSTRPELVYCQATANGQFCSTGCRLGGLNP